MTVLYLLLLVLAAACFAANVFGRAVGTTNRPVNLVALGLFFWVLVPLLQTISALD